MPYPVVVYPDRECLQCGKPFKIDNTRDIKRRKYCSMACAALYRHKMGTLHPYPKTTKKCRFCKKEYKVDSNSQRYCSTCVPDASAEFRMRTYRMCEYDFQVLLINQNGLCKLCDKPLSDDTITVDHDHSCCPGPRTCGSCIRGLLCRHCNSGLGFLEKSGWLERATAYLDRGKLKSVASQTV